MGEDLTSTSAFVTNKVFNSREEITKWVHDVGYSVGCVVITKRSKAYPNGDVYKVVFMCEHSGVYKSNKVSSRHTGTRKFNCPFELIALHSAKNNWWTLRVVCDTHNHAIAQHMEGHPYAMRLNEDEFQLTEDLSAQHVKPRYILSTLKDRSVENAYTSRTIYNENASTPPNPYLPQIPILFHPYITQIQDVLGDGNCGFRAISTCLGGHEDAWDVIRTHLMDELKEHHEYYSYVIGSDCVRVYEALNFFQRGVFAPERHWITMPEMGILTASRFNVILHVITMQGSMTYLPFRTQPPPSSQHVSIAIVYVNNNHYIKVVLNGEYPMPTLVHHWTRWRLQKANTWIFPYEHRLNMYQEYIARTRTREHIDLNE